jgi:uncharacterized protein YggE
LVPRGDKQGDMKRLTLAVAAFALAAASGITPAAAQTAPVIPPAITVSGTGTVQRNPDKADVSFTIVTNDDDATRATSQNNARYSALLAKLAPLGIPATAVKTSYYNAQFVPRPPQPNPQSSERYGYVVTRSVDVTRDRTDDSGAVIDAGVAAGVTSVGGVTFGLRDERAAYRDALAAAVADAAAQAAVLAAAAHVRLGGVLQINAGGDPNVGPRPMFRAALAASAPVPTELPPSDLTFNATVSVRYAIAP